MLERDYITVEDLRNLNTLNEIFNVKCVEGARYRNIFASVDKLSTK